MAGHNMAMILVQLYAFKIVSWIHDPCISVTVNIQWVEDLKGIYSLA